MAAWEIGGVVMSPGKYTGLFFLDEATAPAAGYQSNLAGARVGGEDHCRRLRAPAVLDARRAREQIQGMSTSKHPKHPKRPASLQDLRDQLRKFAADRDWDQFHSPKNLAIALSVEASELLEHFQWITADQSQSLSVEEIADVRKEMADVLLYLIRLADKIDVDLLEAAGDKLSENARKYPVEKARGSSKKYTEF